MDLQEFLAPYRTPVDCVFDVETFYVKGKGPKSYSVQNMTTWQYVHDPRFDAYLTAVYAPDYQQVVPTPEFDWSYLDGKVVGAHNAGFDELVFNRLKELKIVPASCNPKRWVCTADMAAYYRVKRSLANAAKVMLDIGLDKGIRDRMSGKTLQNARDEGFYDELIAYGASDARVSYQLAEKYLAGWPDWEQWLSEEMRHRGWAGVHIDQTYLQECIEKLEVVRFEAGQKIPWDWDDTKTPLAAAKMREQCRIEGIWCPESFAKTDERCEIWEEEFSDRFPWVRAVRDWRRSNTYLKKFQKIQGRIREDGTAPLTIKYAGAHTLRTTAEEGFNVLNLERKPKFGADIRKVLVPKPDNVFILADLSQIEPRVLNWIAGDTVALEAMKTVSPYYVHAKNVMGYRGSPSDLKSDDPATKLFYQLVKARCLAEGTLVLTETGYTPIQDVGMLDRVWDGKEWVTHDGVICQGYARCVKAGSERFTEDHEIYSAEFVKNSAGDVSKRKPARELAWRSSPYSSWQDVWKLARAVARISAREVPVIFTLLVHRVRQRVQRGLAQLVRRSYETVLGLRARFSRTQQGKENLGS